MWSILKFQKIVLICALLPENISSPITITNSAAKLKERKPFQPFLPTVNSCNSTADNPTCGTVEYLGCTGSKRFYHESGIKMSWFEAWEYCRSLGLHLASLDSKYEQLFIEIFLPPIGTENTESYWTSGNDLGKEGQFTWMSNGRAVSYTNFRPGEPNNRFGNEHCIEMVIKPGTLGFLWNDRNCLSKAYSLCQQDLRFPDEFVNAGVKI